MAGPLDGIRILDFSTLLPGPFATMMLGDLGAEILKVEAPHRPDLMRLTPPFDNGVSAGHMAVNRNKKSIALDLKKPESPEIVKRLVRLYDVLLEQFRPGVMDRLRLGYDELEKANQRLIYCSLTGYGQTGPYRDRAGHDINYLAISGILSFSGRAEHGPVPQGVQIADVGAGSYNAVTSILAAIIHRERTGEGQYLDVSMTDGCIGWETITATRFMVGGENPRYEGEFLNGGSFYDCYKSKDGKYISVGSIEPQFFAALCKGIGREDLAAAQGWGMQSGDVWKSIKKEIADALARKSLQEWMEIFKDLDACVEPVLTVEEMMEHPQVKARGMVVSVMKPDGTSQQQINSPFRFSRTPPEIRTTGPGLGEHTEEILRSLGYKSEEIESLRSEGVFG